MITDRYYFTQLSDSERVIYQKLYKGVLNLDSEIHIDGTFSSLETINQIFKAITADNPFLYYFNQTLLNVKQSVVETVLIPQYFCSRDQIQTYNTRIENIVNQLMLDLQLSEATETEKIRRVHDYFCENIIYDSESQTNISLNRLVAAHSIIGVFAKQRAVCEGISKAFKLVLNTADVKCIVVDGLGDSEEAGGNKNGRHAWNIVRIDGKPYHMDLTWDLASSRQGCINYDYYCLPDTDICLDHSDFHGVPSCCSNVENYFVQNQLDFSTRQEVFQFVQQGLVAGQLDFYFRYRGCEGIEQILKELVQYLHQKLFNNGIQGKISSSMRREQGCGRVRII